MKLRPNLIKLVVFLCILCSAIIVTLAVTSNLSSWAPSPEISQSQKQINNSATPIKDDIPEAVADDVISRLHALRASADLKGLIEEGDRIESRWGEEGGRNYGLVVREFLGALTTGKIVEQDPGVFDLSQKYAVRALKRAETYDLETEAHLLLRLEYPIQPTVLDENGIKQRRERAGLWLHALRRLETEKDKHFDPKATGPMNASPPEETGLPPGVSPEAVKDLKLRAEYEKAIEENRKRIEHFNWQYRLRQNEPWIIDGGVKYISKAYAYSASDPKELDQLLEEYSISKDIRTKIKSETKKIVDNGNSLPGPGWYSSGTKLLN
jgi:hypothetical protein